MNAALIVNFAAIGHFTKFCSLSELALPILLANDPFWGQDRTCFPVSVYVKEGK